MSKNDPVSVFENEKDRTLNEWCELLRFASVGTDPKHAADCRACAEWLADHLRSFGMSARLLETASQPVVYAERRREPDRPAVLFYGHYDVQPVEPLDAWETPPFEPNLRDGRLYARGAEDNKGQLFYFIKALEWLIKEDRLGATVKVLIEGEEESGSAGTTAALPEWRDLLQADVLMVTDTNMADNGAPAIVMGLRGIVHLTAELSGPHNDLHSGVHGGAAPNPALEMGRLAASLFEPNGRVAVPGFYDDVTEPTDRERELIRIPPFDSDRYATAVGVPPVAGEKEYGPAERLGFRPSLDVNGIHAGYEGSGVKTIIPARAILKLTARLVPDQDPARCLDAIIAHLHAQAPGGLKLSIPEKGVSGPGFRLNPDSEIVATARSVLDTLCEKDTVLLWSGASIPIITALSGVSGADPLLVGFAKEEDRIHAPNESFSIEQFRLGFLYCTRILERL